MSEAARQTDGEAGKEMKESEKIQESESHDTEAKTAAGTAEEAANESTVEAAANESTAEAAANESTAVSGTNSEKDDKLENVEADGSETEKRNGGEEEQKDEAVKSTETQHTATVPDSIAAETSNQSSGAVLPAQTVEYDEAQGGYGANAQYQAAYYQQAPAMLPTVVAEPSAEPIDYNRRLHVSNLPFRVREPELKQLFEAHGVVEEVEIIYNERGSKGFGFISYANAKDAEAARVALNGHYIDGRRMECNWATKRNNDRPATKKWPAPGATMAAVNLGYGGYPMAAGGYAYAFPGYFPTGQAWPGTYYDPSQVAAASGQYAYGMADPNYAQWYAQYYSGAQTGSNQEAGGPMQSDVTASQRFQPY